MKSFKKFLGISKKEPKPAQAGSQVSQTTSDYEPYNSNERSYLQSSENVTNPSNLALNFASGRRAAGELQESVLSTMKSEETPNALNFRSGKTGASQLRGSVSSAMKSAAEMEEKQLMTPDLSMIKVDKENRGFLSRAAHFLSKDRSFFPSKGSKSTTPFPPQELTTILNAPEIPVQDSSNVLNPVPSASQARPSAMEKSPVPPLNFESINKGRGSMESDRETVPSSRLTTNRTGFESARSAAAGVFPSGFRRPLNIDDDAVSVASDESDDFDPFRKRVGADSGSIASAKSFRGDQDLSGFDLPGFDLDPNKLPKTPRSEESLSFNGDVDGELGFGLDPVRMNSPRSSSASRRPSIIDVPQFSPLSSPRSLKGNDDLPKNSSSESPLSSARSSVFAVEESGFPESIWSPVNNNFGSPEVSSPRSTSSNGSGLSNLLNPREIMPKRPSLSAHPQSPRNSESSVEEEFMPSGARMKLPPLHRVTVPKVTLPPIAPRSPSKASSPRSFDNNSISSAGEELWIGEVPTRSPLSSPRSTNSGDKDRSVIIEIDLPPLEKEKKPSSKKSSVSSVNSDVEEGENTPNKAKISSRRSAESSSRSRSNSFSSENSDLVSRSNSPSPLSSPKSLNSFGGVALNSDNRIHISKEGKIELSRYPEANWTFAPEKLGKKQEITLVSTEGKKEPEAGAEAVGERSVGFRVKSVVPLTELDRVRAEENEAKILTDILLFAAATSGLYDEKDQLKLDSRLKFNEIFEAYEYARKNSGLSNETANDGKNIYTKANKPKDWPDEKFERFKNFSAAVQEETKKHKIYTNRKNDENIRLDKDGKPVGLRLAGFDDKVMENAKEELKKYFDDKSEEIKLSKARELSEVRKRIKENIKKRETYDKQQEEKESHSR